MEYIVTVTKDTNWQEIHNQISTDTSGSPVANIPDRAVPILKLRPNNTRNTHYDLLSDEATALKNDSRVLDVHQLHQQYKPAHLIKHKIIPVNTKIMD
jgi:hypothetical protein